MLPCDTLCPRGTSQKYPNHDLCLRGRRQVYKAVLRETGQEVAVKVQRPGVEPVILRDLFIFRSMARFINPLCKARAAPHSSTALRRPCWEA